MDNHEEQALKLLEQHEKKQINDVEFLREFGKIKVWFSTPFGDHKDGGTRLFLIPGPDDTGYLPLFSTQERAVEFFEKTGRAGYLLIHSEFCEVLKTNREVNEGKTPVKIGAIVDPGYYGITVDVKNLDAVIDMAR
ncbi:hypothetical protein B0O40_2246 [Ruminococcaceae bacterium R-25]|nr:hypothetical protein B0O40_2246 [Ruminococcaceae bacterium R-25]SUQ22103.1 hypothetical protein SAMN06297423_2246 [Oscillospiraceae bacterium]